MTESKTKLTKLTQDVDAAEKNLEKMTQERNRWKERAEIPKKRVLHLPAELAYGTVHDFSSLVEQLVECLLDLQVKDKQLMECKRSLENYHVRKECRK